MDAFVYPSNPQKSAVSENGKEAVLSSHSFFDDRLLLTTPQAEEIYAAVKDLPIIDCHCHLNEKEIAADRHFSDLSELWLGGDHYKWRAMRLCSVPERLITGDAPGKDKFLAYARIMPKLIGNPLYYWTHLELKQIFGIRLPLNEDTADLIWEKTSEMLPELGVCDLLKQFKVTYIATTDDPFSPLDAHGDYDGIKVRPTFRPDRCFAEGISHDALEKRLDYFLDHGCVIADHGFDGVGRDTADLEWLMAACAERDMVLQLHFGTMRNINSRAFQAIGRDAGFDVFRASVDTDAVASLLDRMADRGKLPRTVLYSLNDNATRALTAISGAFPNVLVGAAWWFNDTVCGIRRQLETCGEYGVLGMHPGMLTDSRSFASYVRFDFYRRILSSYIGEKVALGEYDGASANALAADLCYNNVKELMKQ